MPHSPWAFRSDCSLDVVLGRDGSAGEGAHHQAWGWFLEPTSWKKRISVHWMSSVIVITHSFIPTILQVTPIPTHLLIPAHIYSFLHTGQTSKQVLKQQENRTQLLWAEALQPGRFHKSEPKYKKAFSPLVGSPETEGRTTDSHMWS